jgi:hypothetical protein
VALGAAMGSLNADVQQLVATGRWGHGWRDSAVTTTAGALLLVAVVHFVRRRHGQPYTSEPARPPGVAGSAYAVRGGRFELSTGAVAIAVVLLAGAVTVSAAANKRQRDTTMATSAARLADRLAVEMADFDPGPDGAVRRCALRAEFLKLYGDSPFSVRRFDESLEIASRQRAAVSFCPGVTD